MAGAALRVVAVDKLLRTKHRNRVLLRDVSFEVRPGESAGIWSTGSVANRDALVAALVGDLSLDGGAIGIGKRLPRDGEIREVADLPMDPDRSLWRNLTLHLRSAVAAPVKTVANEVLDVVGLADVRKHQAGELDPLERKIAAIAAACALGPRFIVANDIGAGFGASERDQLIRALLRCARAREIGVVYTTSSVAQVWFADSHWLLHATGRLENLTDEPGRQLRVV